MRRRTIGDWVRGAARPAVADAVVVAIAALVCVAVWRGDAVVPAVISVLLGGVLRWPAGVIAVAVVLGAVGAVRSDQAWSSLAPDELGGFTGWVRLVDDPQPYPASTRVIVEVDGERYEAWFRGRAGRLRVETWRAGEWIEMSGERSPLDVERRRRVAWQHVVGRFEIEWVGDRVPGGPLARASNRVRGLLEDASTALPAPDGSLFRGLVIGDDRDQPPEMLDRFRRSGLSHLTAVSGQNVAFVIAACGPLLVRLRPLSRWAVTVAVIAWFVVLTRFEPSILRAGTMAALSATAYVRGAERTPLRLLALAVIGLVLVDPLLVWSVGFWLSVGATAGVCTAGPWLASRLVWAGPLAVPLGVTLGAQLGVVIPSVAVFGRLPLVSIPANLLAVPVAGFVMLVGLPAGLVAGLAAPLAPVLMLPARIGTRWVDTVAAVAARLEPGPPASWWGWAAVAVTVVAWVGLGRRIR